RKKPEGPAEFRALVPVQCRGQKPSVSNGVVRLASKDARTAESRRSAHCPSCRSKRTDLQIARVLHPRWALSPFPYREKESSDRHRMCSRSRRRESSALASYANA